MFHGVQQHGEYCSTASRVVVLFLIALMYTLCHVVSYLSLSDAHCQLFHRLIQGHFFFLLQLSPNPFHPLNVIINMAFNLLCMGGK